MTVTIQSIPGNEHAARCRRKSTSSRRTYTLEEVDDWIVSMQRGAEETEERDDGRPKRGPLGCGDAW